MSTLTTQAPRPILDAPPAITELFREWMFGSDMKTRHGGYRELLAELKYRHRAYYLTPTHAVWLGWGKIRSMPRSLPITGEEYR